jgi:hypothetical protein
MVNPVKPTVQSQAHAKRIYGWDYAIRHGENGNGARGELGAKYNLKDWIKADSLKDMTGGELLYIIQKGRGNMPAEREPTKPDEVWNLVLLVRSYGKQ